MKRTMIAVGVAAMVLACSAEEGTGIVTSALVAGPHLLACPSGPHTVSAVGAWNETPTLDVSETLDAGSSKPTDEQARALCQKRADALKVLFEEAAVRECTDDLARFQCDKCSDGSECTRVVTDVAACKTTKSSAEVVSATVAEHQGSYTVACTHRTRAHAEGTYKVECQKKQRR